MIKGSIAAIAGGILLAAGLVAASPASAFDGSTPAFAGWQPAPDAALGGTRAKGFVHMYGNVEDNSVDSSGTGVNDITNAFTGAQGVFAVIQNTGNAALIQNATVVDVTINSAPALQ